MNPLSIYAPNRWDMYDSYGLIACQLAMNLEALGYQINALARNDTQLPNQPPALRAITQRAIVPSLGGIVIGYPTGYVNQPVLARLGPRVAITMFETSRMPDTWREPLNQCAAVIVPSKFLIEIFRAGGVTVPIHAIPLGIGEGYTPRPRQADRPFRFLAFLDRGRRKGSHWAQFAFMRAFGDDPAVELWLKGRAVRDPQPNDPRIFKPVNTNFRVYQEDYTEGELADFYGECDALINPNMGEGFGLIPREFAATGGVALTTGWGGTAEQIDQWGVPLPFAMEDAPASQFPSMKNLDLGQWPMPDIDQCAAIMRQVVENRQAYLADAMRMAPGLPDLYSWRKFAAGVAEVWERAKLDFSRAA